MNDSDFDDRVRNAFLPNFCKYRNYDISGFKSDTLGRVGKYDAGWFLKALSSKTVKQVQGGALFTTEIEELSGAKEQIFWSGNKSISPRPITLWVEPIITIGAAGRLHGEFKWPNELIGLQSKGNWAFDLMAYNAHKHPIIACEVKKSEREIDFLIEAMMDFVSSPPLDEEPSESKLRNAYRKVIALRRLNPKYFWALGPDNYGSVFRIVSGRLEEVEQDVLTYVSGPNSD